MAAPILILIVMSGGVISAVGVVIANTPSMVLGPRK